MSAPDLSTRLEESDGPDSGEVAGVGASSPWQAISAIVRRPASAAALIVLLVALVVAIFGAMLAPSGANDVDVNKMLQGPSGAHWFGTDELGRDVLSRTMIAARASIEVSCVSVAVALTAGVLLGLLAGYYGRFIGTVIMRCMDVMFAFPVMLLAIAIVAVLGPGESSAMIAIAVVYTPIFARITRASVLAVREQVYVRASISIGASDTYILRRHILPNVAGPIIVQTSLSLGFAILSEAALSFLGLGIQPPQPSWGSMLDDARGFVQQAWWMAVFPGLAIVLTVLAFNVLGDALRDVLDPRQRSRIDNGGRP